MPSESIMFCEIPLEVEYDIQEEVKGDQVTDSWPEITDVRYNGKDCDIISLMPLFENGALEAIEEKLIEKLKELAWDRP